MTEIHGFKLIEERDIPEINSHARLFKHIKTGAELLSLENDDENKSFMVAFRTPAPDDTGVPHILEHSVLGGSRKYPVKDPFVQLLKTSVNTFLNAMTFDDMTAYPVASTNLQDFYNLVDVYLDATFFPLITEETLMQEGWHYEADGEETPLNFKGVVFNEMKAVYSTPEQVLSLVRDRAMWPDTPYKNSAGGVPAAIPDLTYEQFKRFHETYYHPSNARIVFSGDDNPDERLRIVNEYLSEFDALDIANELPLQAPFNEPKIVIEGYDAGEDAGENKSMVQVSWLLPEITDRKRMIALSVLAHALVATSASPLRKALIDSGLGEGLVGGGLDTFKRQASFSTGLKGIKESDAQQVVDLIVETLGNLAEEGIEPETIKAALNTIEFNARERNYGNFPRGLATAIFSMPAWMHGANPLDAMAFEAALSEVKQRYAEEDDFFERMIGEYLIDNPHRVTVVLRPDGTVGPERDKAERERLDKVKAAMTSDEIKKVLETQKALELLQQTPDKPEDLAKIPSLTRADIDPKITTTAQEIIERDGTRIYLHDQPTSGIIYMDVALDLRTVPVELLPYVELYGEALTKMGTENETFVQLSQRIGSKTGGIGATTVTGMKRDGNDYLAYLFIGAKTMTDQAGDLLDILRDILLTVNLDNQARFKQIVLERKVGMERYLAMAGHVVAASRVAAQMHEPGFADEQMSGTEHLFFLRELVEQIDADWDSVRAALEAVRDHLVNRAAALVNVTMEGDKWAAFEPQLTAFLDDLPSAEVIYQEWGIQDGPDYEGLTLPAQVNFNAKAANLYQTGYTLHGSVSVIMKHLSREYMWQQVRVLGGAYGGRIAFNPNSGNVSYLSWRDPNITRTLDVFDGAADYLQALEMSDDDIEKAIIGAIGDLDGYDLPDAKGRKAFMRHLLGYDDAMRQQYRDEVLATTLDDFKSLGEYLAVVKDKGKVAVVGSPDHIKEADEALGGKFHRTTLQ